MWRMLFIGVTVILVYLSYGVASHGGPWAFFTGAIVGAIVTYLFMRYKSEAAANTNVNTQSVNVNLNQNRVRAETIGSMTGNDLLEIINAALDKKLLLTQLQAPAQPIVEPDALKTKPQYIQPSSAQERIARTILALSRQQTEASEE
jgi:hypothetical protein